MEKVMGFFIILIGIGFGGGMIIVGLGYMNNWIK